MAMTMTEKILARAAGKEAVAPGDLIMAKLDLCLGNDVTSGVAIDEFEKAGFERVFDPERIVLIPDHFTPNKDIKSAGLVKQMREFSKKHGLEWFEVGRVGVEHAFLPEQGLVGPGDVVAAGFSGSFPGLNLAVALAAHALDAELIAISSVTASTWGANQPGFTWPEMECLLAPTIIPRASIAVTAGGDGDIARDLEFDGRQMAASIRDEAARCLGAAAFRPADFDDAIRQRMSAYRKAANGRPIALYVNVGGTAASLGESSAVLNLKSGFIRPGPFDRSERRGVMARFAEQGVRVLTLLNIRDLAVRWGIPLAVAGR